MPYVVVTRDAEATAPYAAALAALGLDAIAMPVTRTEPADPAALAAALAREAAAILVASPNAARALLAHRAAAPLAEVWAVGPATARVLAAAGVPAHVPDHARDGASAARALLAARPLAGRRVVVPRAEDGRDEAIAILAAAGVAVDAVTAYRTVAVAADDPAIARGLRVLAAGDAAACTVFAPSQVAALGGLLPLAAIATRWVAIGETTASALRAAGLAPAVAATPTPGGIANAVAAVYPPRP